MRKRVKRNQNVYHMCSLLCRKHSFTSDLCIRMFKKIFSKRFHMKVKPVTQFECNKYKILITQSQHLPFDSLQLNISSELVSNKLQNAKSTKFNSFKLMRTATHEKFMWQVVTVPTKLSDAFGSLLRYAQESINVFFCPT